MAGVRDGATMVPHTRMYVLYIFLYRKCVYIKHHLITDAHALTLYVCVYYIYTEYVLYVLPKKHINTICHVGNKIPLCDSMSAGRLLSALRRH